VWRESWSRQIGSAVGGSEGGSLSANSVILPTSPVVLSPVACGIPFSTHSEAPIRSVCSVCRGHIR
jgi:hypothetical protein